MQLPESPTPPNDGTSTAVVDELAPDARLDQPDLDQPDAEPGQPDAPAVAAEAPETESPPAATEEPVAESAAESVVEFGEPIAESGIEPEPGAYTPPTPDETLSEEAPPDEIPAPVATVALGDESPPPESDVDAVAIVADEMAPVDLDTAEQPATTVDGEQPATHLGEVEQLAPDLGEVDQPSAEATTSETPSDAPEPPAAVKPPKGAHPVIAQVAAAPHRVYLLGKVRKAIATAGEGEQGPWLREAEAYIREQVEERTAAKERLCARAEELQDSTAWRVTGDAYRALFEEWKQVGAAGRELDDQLWARFNTARGIFSERRTKHFEERQQEWSTNRARKEALCAQAENFAESTEWKRTADAIRDLQAQWKATGSAGRDYDDALWGRFNAAKQLFFDRRTAAWEENRARKEAICGDAETLKDSTDWRRTGDAIKAMQAEWKSIGPAGRENEDRLWQRFRAATQVFFDRRSETFAERNREERENLTTKQDLCVRAEALIYATESLAAAREAKDLQAQWKEIGPVPREQSDVLWARFRGACDRIFENASSERDRQQGEWQTRMREAMLRKREQLVALRESITHDEANMERWRDTLSNLQPGAKSGEIAAGLDAKIMDVINRIRNKNERVEELRASIADMEAKLRD